MPFTHPHRSMEDIRKDENVQRECEIIPFPKNEITPVPNKDVRDKRSEINDFEDAFRSLVKQSPLVKKTTFKKERDHLITEMIFLKDRDASSQRSSERMEACDLIADDMFPLERILSASDSEENEILYDQLTVLRNIYINQLITLDYKSNGNFDEQRGLASIELKRFLLQKARLCYNRGIILDKNNFDELFLDHIELRLDKIKNEIRQLLKEAFAIGAHDPIAFGTFKQEVSNLASDTTAEMNFPVRAPALYKERADRKEKPDAFIRRVYAEWLGQGLLRPHIKDLDKPLYQALYKHGIPADFETLLPTAQGRSPNEISRSDIDALAKRRAADRDRSRRLYQKRKHSREI